MIQNSIILKSGETWPLNTAYNGDCMEFMRRMPDKCVDLVLTDPPYGIGEDGDKIRDYNSKSCESWKKRKPKKYEKKEWDNKTPDKEIFDEIFRISKKQIIWGVNYLTDKLPVSGGRIVWDKQVVMPTFSDGEIAWTNASNSVQFGRFLWAGYRKCEDVERIHPTQKPIKLFKWCLEKYAPENALVFDPFLGSFTTAVACHHYGLNWIGCEKDPDYFRDGMARYTRETEQNFMEFEFDTD